MVSKSKKSNRKNNMVNDVNSIVLRGVSSVVRKKIWVGTMTDLKSAMVRELGRKNSKMLPGSPSSLRMVLNRIVNRLRSRGVSVKFGRTSDHGRMRYVRFAR